MKMASFRFRKSAAAWSRTLSENQQLTSEILLIRRATFRGGRLSGRHWSSSDSQSAVLGSNAMLCRGPGLPVRTKVGFLPASRWVWNRQDVRAVRDVQSRKGPGASRRRGYIRPLPTLWQVTALVRGWTGYLPILEVTGVFRSLACKSATPFRNCIVVPEALYKAHPLTRK